MKSLRDLVKLKPAAELKVVTNDNEEGTKKYINYSQVIGERMTIFQKGHGDAVSALGEVHIFKECLQDLYQKFKAAVRGDEKYQDEQKQPIRIKISSLEADIEKRNALLSIKKDKIENHKEAITKIDNDISQVKVDPMRYGVEVSRKPKAQFYIGLFLLLPITIYLLVFYVSASYSAFFKDFETSSITAAIFDGQAFTKAIQDGFLEAVFVGTIPFVFMGLGYLVHMFLKEGKKGIFKIVGLFTVTLLFDMILAYLIEFKIYEFNRTLNSPDFNMGIALQSIEFWGIIFAGFVVYVIWGLVFDFVMKEYENFDKIKIFIHGLAQKKVNIQAQIDDLKIESSEISAGISELKEELVSEQNSLSSIFFPTKDYLEHHSEYVKGWMMAVQKELMTENKKKRELFEATHNCSIAHLDEIEINWKGDDALKEIVESETLRQAE